MDSIQSPTPNLNTNLNSKTLMYQFVFFGILLVLLSIVIIMQYSTTQIVQKRQNIIIESNVGIGSSSYN